MSGKFVRKPNLVTCQ